MSPPKFEAADFFMIRAPMLPAETFNVLVAPEYDSGPVPPLPRRDSGGKALLTLRALLAEPLIRSAVTVASPSLSNSIYDADEKVTDAVGRDTIWRGTFKYLNRMCTRPTPYGLFAGVAAGRFGASTTLRLNRDPAGKASFRPDMMWLAAVLDTAQKKRSKVEPGLRVFSNNTILDIGGRLDIYSSSTPSSSEHRIVSIRASQLVRDVLALAQTPITISALTKLASQLHPGVPTQRLMDLVKKLWDLGYLTADLMPGGSEFDPCGYLADRMASAYACHDTAVELQAIGRELASLGTGGPSDGVRAALQDLRAVENRQRALTPGYNGVTLHVDAALDLVDCGLNRKIGEAIADAVGALTALTISHPGLSVYAREFTETYGSGAEIPILEMLDAHYGIDAPPGYAFPPRYSPMNAPEAEETWRRRDQMIMSWVEQAILEDTPIKLTDEKITELAQAPAQHGSLPLVDVYTQVHARSAEAIDQGDWLAVIAPMGIIPGGATFGRFARMLDDDIMYQLRMHIAHEAELLESHPIYAELSYSPSNVRLNNVTHHPILRPYEIPVNVLPTVQPDRTLPLSDLVVGVRDGLFYIKSRKLGREVIVRQSHMLTPTRADNVCRFLLEVSAEQVDRISSLRDEVLDRLPFCPRMVRGKVVIRPACWNLSAASTPAARASESENVFKQALGDWRETYKVPRYVYLSMHDERLVLDLEDPICQDLLRRKLRRLDKNPASASSYQKIEELLPGFDGAWLHDSEGNSYFSELVIPVKPITCSATVRHSATFHQHRGREVEACRMPDGEHGGAPDREWLYLKLYAAPYRHNEVICSSASFAGNLVRRRVADQWFFVRYADPRPHIRARIRAKGTTTAEELFAAGLDWTKRLVADGVVRDYTVDTYKPEIDRYGGRYSINLIERIFHSDSVGVSSVLRKAADDGVDVNPLVTGAFTLDLLMTALGLDDRSKLNQDCLARRRIRSSAEYRDRGTMLMGMLMAARNHEDKEGSEVIARLYDDAMALCRGIGAKFARLEQCGKLARPWPEIVDVLAHMHVNRVLGSDGAQEDEIYGLLRRSLLSIVARDGDRGGT